MNTVNPFDKTLTAPKSKIHGHSMIIHNFYYIKKFVATIEDPVLIEIGSQRGTGSTCQLAGLCQNHGMQFVTVDPDEEAYEAAQKIISKMNSSFKACQELGEEYLERYPAANIAVLYLDAFDIVTGWPHKERTLESYARRDTALTNDLAYKMHLDAAKAAIGKIIPGGFICIDDVWLEQDAWQGKGRTAIPFLLGEGCSIINYMPNALLLQKPTSHLPLPRYSKTRFTLNRLFARYIRKYLR